jgi:pimeloyl-ACP methyl ester carboxylesterase
MTRTFLALAVIWTMIAATAGSAWAAQPAPPSQPASGPGGSEYRFEAVDAKHLGTAPTGYWLFSPARDATSEMLPVVVFLHGFGAVEPDGYRAWIDHNVRRGAILIYPDYQTADLTQTPSADYEPNAFAGITSALSRLSAGDIGPVDMTAIAIVGHSLGGVLALNIAALAPEHGLPDVAAVMSVEPGGCAECGGISTLIGLPLADLSGIGIGTRVIVMVGADDQVVSDQGARTAWRMLTNVPVDHRDFVLMHSDHRGSPALIADHYAPLAASSGWDVNAMDWFGTWKLFDILTDCAFLEHGCSTSFGGSPIETDMGRWSDGTPVVPLTVTDAP